jgi:hypothetical protein
MLTSTFLITLAIEYVVLNFVFMGYHFYIGVLLCLCILYLLLSLGFSNPGVTFARYESLQAHFDLETCTAKCTHAATLREVIF